MVTLNGTNLGERQKDLNVKVKEAVLNNVNFDEIKDKAEQCDVDTLFKIDVASKYKNIEYIIQVLKSGDSLHISRALKCDWMFDDEFSHIINTDYLHHNVFPYISPKMKKKLIIAIAMNVRNEDRVTAFCNYCKNVKLTNLVQKFIYFTTDTYKLDIIQNNPDLVSDLRRKNNLKHFIGDSFSIADAYLNTLSEQLYKLKTLNELSYLYSVSNEKYLDMLENQIFTRIDNVHCLGLRISKDILVRHKDRVLRKPSLYINILKISYIVKYSTKEDAKLYFIGLLPDDRIYFWYSCFLDTYEFILNMLPHEERFEFMKKAFNEKYPDEAFETVSNFFSYEYCRYMTTEQKEKWAVDYITSHECLLGTGNDYKWYKYVNFKTSFDGIKKLIMITPDNERRNDMIHVLIKSAKNQRDLEKLFKYYYERHNNELKHIKEAFVDGVASNHNVFEFDKGCWEAFNKIYQNLDLYSISEPNSTRYQFKIIALIYHVINELDVHEALKIYMNRDINLYELKENTNKLSKEKQDMVYQYVFEYYVNKIREFESVPYDDEVKYKVEEFILLFLELLLKYNKTKEDIPEVVMKFIELDRDGFYYHSIWGNHLPPPEKELTQDDLIRFLKQDSSLVVQNLPSVKKNIENYRKFYIGRLLHKLKVFFPNDISQEYLKFFNDLLSTNKTERSVIRAACCGIFILAETSFKVDFLIKHAPTQGKVNRFEIDEALLNIQEAICATAYYSRPPLPLKYMFMYITGDYVQKCLHMFNFYFANLSPALCKEFLKATLNNPLSIQKHGLRLTFACCNAEEISDIVLQHWKNTKNISLRLIIYKLVFDKFVDADQTSQIVLFDTLRKLTLQLQQDDDQKVFSLLTSGRIPINFIPDYIEAAWLAVSGLADNCINESRRCQIIDSMCYHVKEIRQDLVRPIIESFVKNEINTAELLKLADYNSHGMFQSMFDLTTSYIVYIRNKDDLDTKLELTKRILTLCCGRNDLDPKNRYELQRFGVNLVEKLMKLSFSNDFKNYTYLNTYFEAILQEMNALSPIHEIYMLTWNLQINKVARNALFEINTALSAVHNEFEEPDIVKRGVLNFSKDIGDLVNSFIERKLYFRHYQSQIVHLLHDIIHEVKRHIKGHYANIDGMLIAIGETLMAFKSDVTYLLLLDFMHSHNGCINREDFKAILNDLRNLNNPEVQCILYDKFSSFYFEC